MSVALRPGYVSRPRVKVFMLSSLYAHLFFILPSLLAKGCERKHSKQKEEDYENGNSRKVTGAFVNTQ